MNENDLRNELHRELDGAPSWKLSPDEVMTRARRRNQRNMALTAVTVVAALGVTAASLFVLSSGGPGDAPNPANSGGELAVTVPATSAPPETSAPSPQPATVAAFTCDDSGIHPSELTVAAGSGGVAVTVDASGPMAFSLGDAGTNAPVGGEAVDYPGGGRYWPLAPGDYTAKCVSDSVGEPDTVAGSTVHVVDPGGYYVDATFGCENFFGSFIDFAPNGSSLERAVHDALDGYAKQGDVIRQVGYQKAALPQYALDRNGEIVVIATMREMGKKGWIPDQVNGCAGVNPGDVKVHPPIESS
jgi:hypothetical protein